MCCAVLRCAVLCWGTGPIPWAIGGEIFPEAPRATAMCTSPGVARV
jgi:hypothetical protein